MIVCVHEYPDDRDYGRIVFIDTCIAVSELQRAYVAAIDAAIGTGKSVLVPAECSLMCEEDDEIARMVVDLPQHVEAVVEIEIDGV